jgi:hypothetical protein
MGTFQADTLRDSIESGWSLSGALAKTASTTMKNPVKFYAHPQVKQIETKKAIEVIKNTPLSNDTIRATQTDVNDVFEVSCRYTVEDVKNSKWDISEARIEDMCDEVLRIVKTIYDPSAGTGTFFRSITNWRNDDDISKISQVLKRTMTLTLFRIKSEETTVFEGYKGVLVYDTSASDGDDKPAGDYTYTEAHDVQWTGGFAQIPEIVDEGGDGEHVPMYFTGSYSGRFNCKMNVKKADFTDTGSEQIHIMGNPLLNGEVAEMYFLYSMTNTEATPATITASIPLRVLSLEPMFDLESISSFRLIAQISSPPTYTIT